MTERLKDAHLSPRFLYLFLRRRRILCASVAVLLILDPTLNPNQYHVFPLIINAILLR